MLAIATLTEYVARVSEITARLGADRIWFRGVNHGWPILPGAYRAEIDEAEQLLEFHVRSYSLESHADQAARTDTSYEYRWRRYFLAQHYGLATRLVDWTENPLVALYFAVRGRTNGQQPRVWFLDPGRLNEAAVGDESLIVPGGDFSAWWLPPDGRAKSGCTKRKKVQFSYGDRQYDNALPIAVYGPRSNPRLVAQQGVFTVHGASEVPLERVAGNDMPFVEVEPSCVEALRGALRAFGVFESALFPELDKLAAEVRAEMTKPATVDVVALEGAAREVTRGRRKTKLAGRKAAPKSTGTPKKAPRRKKRVVKKKAAAR